MSGTDDLMCCPRHTLSPPVVGGIQSETGIITKSGTGIDKPSPTPGRAARPELKFRAESGSRSRSEDKSVDVKDERTPSTFTQTN
ncbi:hypothetical protein EVAR_49209_1 [Eumeta japonica]|uniref:Uncharacterized protein n=1 Tax=Eumeta variegata TaxID=151549 RepID=A0A4C1XLX1_EUMVA|nr:hypothetical protein EVAR_49209_1 [Eumeta japonica]